MYCFSAFLLPVNCAFTGILFDVSFTTVSWTVGCCSDACNCKVSTAGFSSGNCNSIIWLMSSLSSILASSTMIPMSCSSMICSPELFAVGSSQFIWDSTKPWSTRDEVFATSSTTTFSLPLTGTIWDRLIGSGNGLVPDGTKPLPESMMTSWGTTRLLISSADDTDGIGISTSSGPSGFGISSLDASTMVRQGSSMIWTQLSLAVSWDETCISRSAELWTFAPLNTTSWWDSDTSSSILTASTITFSVLLLWLFICSFRSVLVKQ